MALTVNTNIINDTDGYLLDAKNIKGTYIVADDIDIRDALPSATTVEGTLCYVKSEDKTYRMTADGWVEEISGAVQDIIINGGSIVKDGIADIPIATDKNLGVVGINPYWGISIHSNGNIKINSATSTDINNRNSFMPITPSVMEYAVMEALSNTMADIWTDERMAAARNRLGITEHKVVRL